MQINKFTRRGGGEVQPRNPLVSSVSSGLFISLQIPAMETTTPARGARLPLEAAVFRFGVCVPLGETKCF